MMTSVVTCNHKHCKSGATSYEMLLSNVMKKCPQLTQSDCLFCIYTQFCEGVEMMGSDKICTASCNYVHVLSLCHLYTLPTYSKSHKCELPKDNFLVYSSHNFTIESPWVVAIFIESTGMHEKPKMAHVMEDGKRFKFLLRG
jgi:hypothetical protein